MKTRLFAVLILFLLFSNFYVVTALTTGVNEQVDLEYASLLIHKSVKSTQVKKGYIFGEYSEIQYYNGHMEYIYSNESIIAFGLSDNSISYGPSPPFPIRPFIAFHVIKIEGEHFHGDINVTDYSINGIIKDTRIWYYRYYLF